MKSKHDKINKQYANKLKGMDKILVNHEYKNHKNTKVIGEIDCFTYRITPTQNIAYAIETKSTHTSKQRRKALSQLGRAEDKFLPRYQRDNKIKFDKFVWLYATKTGIKCEGVTYLNKHL